MPAFASTGSPGVPAAVAARGVEVSGAVDSAVRAALRFPEARVEVTRESAGRAPACEPLRAEVQRAVRGSGRVPVKLYGQGCTGWEYVQVRLFAKVAVATRSIAAGEKLAGAVAFAEREVLESREPLTSLPEDAAALRAIPDGAEIPAAALRPTGPQPGDAVTVVLRTGLIELTEPGRAVSCSHGRACAVLPGGKRVEGIFAEGKLLVTQ